VLERHEAYKGFVTILFELKYRWILVMIGILNIKKQDLSFIFVSD